MVTSVHCLILPSTGVRQGIRDKHHHQERVKDIKISSRCACKGHFTSYGITLRLIFLCEIFHDDSYSLLDEPI